MTTPQQFVDVTRTRVRLTADEAAIIATALATGSPVLHMCGSQQASHFAELVTAFWKDTNTACFPGLLPGDDASVRMMDSVSTMLARMGPFYAELFLFSFPEGTSFINACVWAEMDPDVITQPGSFGLETCCNGLFLWTSTRSEKTTLFNWAGNYASYATLDQFVFDGIVPQSPTSVAPTRMFTRAFDIETLRGPDFDAPHWDAIPFPGKDIHFDAAYPEGVSAAYRLHRRARFTKRRTDV